MGLPLGNNVADESSHPYRQLVLPADAPFELRPAPFGKGWGVFATRDIQSGTTVLADPTLWIFKHKYIKQITDSLDWEFRARTLKHITTEDIAEAVYVGLSPHNKAQLRLLCLNGDPKKKWSDYSVTLEEVISQNLFVMWYSRSEPGGMGMHLIAPRFNHSCNPNLARDVIVRSKFVILKAVKNIAAGAELTLPYDSPPVIGQPTIPTYIPLATPAERTALLGFVCRCDFCNSSFEEKELVIDELRNRNDPSGRMTALARAQRAVNGMDAVWEAS